MKWSELSPKQKALGLKRWHAKRDQTELSPEAKQELARKRRLAEEVAPGLTREDLLEDVQAGTRQKFGEAEAALGQSFQQNRAQTVRTGDWFKQYQDAINEAARRQAAVNQAAVQGVQQLQQGLNTDSQAQWAGQQAAMQADAANRGATVDPRLADQAHNASNVRGMLTGSYGAMLLGQGANQQADMANRAATSVQQRNEALARKQTERGDLQRERRRLKREKGDFKVTYATQIKTGAEDSALKRALTLAQVGETTADTESKRADTISKTLQNQYFAKYGKLPSAGNDLSPLEQYRLSYLRKHGYFPPTGPPKEPSDDGKDKFGNTPKDRERYVNYWDRSKSLAKLIGGKDVGELAQLIIAKDSTVPPWMARAAAQQIINGYVGPGSRTRLRKHGVRKGYKVDNRPSNDGPVYEGGRT